MNPAPPLIGLTVNQFWGQGEGLFKKTLFYFEGGAG